VWGPRAKTRAHFLVFPNGAECCRTNVADDQAGIIRSQTPDLQAAGQASHHQGSASVPLQVPAVFDEDAALEVYAVALAALALIEVGSMLMRCIRATPRGTPARGFASRAGVEQTQRNERDLDANPVQTRASRCTMPITVFLERPRLRPIRR
jgi:hypothetical protein